eukprot:gene1198-1609_t
MNGRSYHFLSNSSRKMSGINYFTFDGLEDAHRHAGVLNDRLSGEQRSENKKLENGFLTSIFNELKDVNEFVQELQWIGRGEDAVRQVTASLNVQTSVMEVGCLLSDESEGNIIYKFNVKGMGRTINSASNVVEPLCYVLLFPFGERGWSRDISREVGFMEYMCSRFKMPEKTYHSEFDPIENNDSDPTLDNPQGLLRQWNKAGTKLLATNRFQLMPRLSQKNQGFIFGERSQYASNTADWEEEKQMQNLGGGVDDNMGEEIADSNAGEEGTSSRSVKKTFLSSSFNGSPRHLNELAHNALTIVTEQGSPDVFITGTANPLWPEIQERLFPGQSAYDRPDIVTEVFHARKQAFVHNLRNGKYFGGRKT